MFEASRESWFVTGCTESPFWDSYDSLNYYLSKAKPTLDLQNAIRDLSLKLIITRKGVSVERFLSGFVPEFLSIIEALVCFRLSIFP